LFFLMTLPPTTSTLFPYTTLFRSGELNFSSDVDLVYGYEEDGESDGPRPLAAEQYYARLGQQLAKLLDENTAEGFCHRVDLRLRDRKSTRLNSSHVKISYAVFCLK